MTDLIVDANSLYARAWYATKQVPYEALIATLNMTIMVVNPARVGEKIDRILYCWDAGQKKPKEREERPAEYEETKDYVRACVQGIYGAANAKIKGYEADDVIATAATKSSAEHVIIATGDKDLTQLNSSKVSIFDLNSKSMISRREIVGRWKVKHPSHVAIALAIQGDSADKITGIKGWGPKKVEALFEAVKRDMEFDVALETIFNQIPPEKQDEFIESLGLTLLNCDIPDVFPGPAPLTLAEPSMLEAQGIDAEVITHYRRVYSVYHGHGAEDALMKMLSAED